MCNNSSSPTLFLYPFLDLNTLLNRAKMVTTTVISDYVADIGVGDASGEYFGIRILVGFI